MGQVASSTEVRKGSRPVIPSTWRLDGFRSIAPFQIGRLERSIGHATPLGKQITPWVLLGNLPEIGA